MKTLGVIVVVLVVAGLAISNGLRDAQRARERRGAPPLSDYEKQITRRFVLYFAAPFTAIVIAFLLVSLIADVNE